MARKRLPAEHNGSASIREDRRVRSQIEVHVAGVCVRQRNGHWEVLIAQRTNERHLYPGKWECGGGAVHYGEGFEQAIKRQIFEELGLEVEVVDMLEFYEIHVERQGIIPGLRFLCHAGEGHVRLNPREFSRSRWVRFPVPTNLPWIEGVKKALDALGSDLLTRLVGRKAPDSERRPIPLPSRAIQ